MLFVMLLRTQADEIIYSVICLVSIYMMNILVFGIAFKKCLCN